MTAIPLHDVLAAIPTVLDRGGRPIVVFDLDSTLLRTGHRHLAILTEFARETAGRSGAPWTRLREVVATLDADDFGYEVSDPLDDAGIEDLDVRRELDAFWAERYFTSDFCVVDEPAPGAVAYVQAAHSAGALVWYLTGRPHEPMVTGTAATLARHGFPLDPAQTRLELRPARFAGDKGFKVVAAREIAAAGTVVGQFENEPANANAMLPIFPAALHFLVGSVHSSAPDLPHPALIPIADFVLP